jgi:hypothetical protein
MRWQPAGSWDSKHVKIKNNHDQVHSASGSWHNEPDKIENIEPKYNNYQLPASYYFLNSQVQFLFVIDLTAAMSYVHFVVRSIGSKRGFKAVRRYHQSFRLAVKVVLS